MVPTGRWVAPAGVLVLALLARLWQIDLTRFFNDQVDFLRSATSFIDSGQIPLSSGLTFAVGTTGAPIRHPPLVTWLLAVPALFSRDPVWVSACVAAFDALAAPVLYVAAKRLSGSTLAGVAAGTLYALNPAAIVFGRMIWNVDFVPLFAAVGLWGLVDFRLRARSWPLAASLLAICWAIELHPVNAVFLPLWLLVAVLGWNKLHPRPMVAGGLLVLASIAPYLYLQTQSGWTDVRNLLRYLGQPKVLDWEVLDRAGAVIGPTMFRRLLPAAGDVIAPFGYDTLTWLLIGLAMLGLAAAWRARAGWIVAAWLALPILASVRHTGAVVPHYLLAIVPAVAVLQGFALGATQRLAPGLGWRALSLASAAGLAALSAWLAVTYAGVQRSVATDPRQLEYGMPLRYSLAAATVVRAQTANEPLYLAVPFLWNRTVPSLAGRQEYQWYWDRQVFVFPRTAAWYLAQNDSFGHAFLSGHFGPPARSITNDAGVAELSLFSLPQDAPRQAFGGPDFVPLSAAVGQAIQVEGYLPSRLAVGQVSNVLILWRVLDASQVPEHLSQFAHLVDESGRTVSTNPDLYDVREPWRTGDLVATGFDLNVRQDTPTGGYRLETGFYDTFSQASLGAAVRVGPLKVADVSPAAPSSAAPLAVLGEGEIGLVRAIWQGPDVVIDWLALTKPRASYTVFVHAVDAGGKLAGQWDGLPHNGNYPTQLWDPGEVIRDVYHLDTQPGPGLRLEIGMYTQPDLKRLPVHEAGSQGITDHATMRPNG